MCSSLTTFQISLAAFLRPARSISPRRSLSIQALPFDPGAIVNLDHADHFEIHAQRIGQHGVVGASRDPVVVLCLGHHLERQGRERADMGRIGPVGVVPEVGNVDLKNAARLQNAIQLAHDGAEVGERRADVLKHMLHQDMVELVVLERPWEGLDVHQDIGFAFLEAISVDPALAFVESASEIEFGHGRALVQVVTGERACMAAIRACRWRSRSSRRAISSR
jgi:hypothetical protein